LKYYRIPDETIKRLPLYVRHLQVLAKDGRASIRSAEFTESLGVRSAQVRKDLAYFGSFGKPGVGYDIRKLLEQLRQILKLKHVNRTAIVGVGDLGSALIRYPGFSRFSFEIVAAFDNDHEKVGQTRDNILVEDISELKTLKKRGIKLAIMAVPARAAQRVADDLVKAGVVGILNFAPCYLTVPKKIKLISVDIAMYLAYLPYYLPGSMKSKNRNEVL